MSLRELAAVSGLFVVLTLFSTYPQVLYLDSAVGAHLDAPFSIWRLAWIAHQLTRSPVHLFDANIFYPERNTLAYSDALLLQGLVAAPFLWLGASPMAVHNVLVLLAFGTAGVGMYVLVRSITKSRLGGIGAGMIFAFQQYRFAHYPQIELLWTCFIPLALWALHRTLATHRIRDALLVAIFVGLQAWSCLYYAVFLITALAIISIAMVIGRREGLMRLATPAVAAIVVGLLMTAPYALPYMRARQIVGARTMPEIKQWSPPLQSYLGTMPTNWLYGRVTSGYGYLEGTLFPGVMPLALVAFAVLTRPRTRELIAYAVLLVVSFDLSLGFNGWLYPSLYSVAWPYQSLRVPARMFVIVSASMAVLAGMAMARLGTLLGRTRWTAAAVAAVATVIFAETVTVPIPLQRIDFERTQTDRFLASQPRAAVFEWPVPRPDTLGITQDPIYMLQSTFHWQPLVNGYSGYHPQSYVELLEHMRTFPSTDALRHLQQVGVRYVILHSAPSMDDYLAVQNQLSSNPLVTFLRSDNLSTSEITLYEVARAE